jgi:hypothetical protein
MAFLPLRTKYDVYTLCKIPIELEYYRRLGCEAVSSRRAALTFRRDQKVPSSRFSYSKDGVVRFLRNINTRRHITEGSALHSHRRENLNCHTVIRLIIRSLGLVHLHHTFARDCYHLQESQEFSRETTTLRCVQIHEHHVNKGDKLKLLHVWKRN